jgi:2-succinyl-5-enolpyruvyl-6-hydroxy-3-cyclohexene-1-carboxylate synthase
VRRFSAASGAAVHAEALSQLRFALAPGEAISDATEWLLGSESWRRRVQPDFVLQLGAAPLSSALQRLLQSDGAPRHAVVAERGWPDPFGKSALIVRSGAAAVLTALSDALGQAPAPSRPLARLWQEASAVARRVVDEHVAGTFDEAAAVVELVESLPSGSVLSVGNSLPPRHLDRYCAAASRALTVLSQRGANGIDGGVAAALGAGSVARAPVTALLGDVSFLHDVGSLWAASTERTLGPAHTVPVAIVVLNNGGGRIFEQLPLAADARVDLAAWTSPHALDLRSAASLYGVGYRRVDARGQLPAALAQAHARPGVTLIEVVVPPDGARTALAAIETRLEARLAALIGAE